jgi:hypothetical protein
MISTQLVHNAIPNTRLITPDAGPDGSSDSNPHLQVGYLPLKSQSRNFEDLLATTSLPPPGPSYYAARRALWLADPGLPLPSPEPSTSRQRLEHLLSQPGGIENEAVWKGGVEKVWKGLLAGGRLKRRLPMRLVVSNPRTRVSPFLTSTDQDYSCRMAP